MATERQRQAARQNVKKAQAAWQGMSHTEHARAQPQGRGRMKPGTAGGGEFYRIVVRPKSEFVTFRTQDVGKPGGIERLAGKRPSGSWATQAWLVSKQDAHVKATGSSPTRPTPGTSSRNSAPSRNTSRATCSRRRTGRTCRSARSRPLPSGGPER